VNGLFALGAVLGTGRAGVCGSPSAAPSKPSSVARSPSFAEGSAPDPGSSAGGLVFGSAGLPPKSPSKVATSSSPGDALKKHASTACPGLGAALGAEPCRGGVASAAVWPLAAAAVAGGAAAAFAVVSGSDAGAGASVVVASSDVIAPASAFPFVVADVVAAVALAFTGGSFVVSSDVWASMRGTGFDPESASVGLVGPPIVDGVVNHVGVEAARAARAAVVATASVMGAGDVETAVGGGPKPDAAGELEVAVAAVAAAGGGTGVAAAADVAVAAGVVAVVGGAVLAACAPSAGVVPDAGAAAVAADGVAVGEV